MIIHVIMYAFVETVAFMTVKYPGNMPNYPTGCNCT